MKWDILVMITAVYTSFIAPLEVAFPDEQAMADLATGNLACDVLFIIDLLVAFRTSYQNPNTGDEIYDPKMIAKNYIKGRFWIYMLAAIPFDYLASGHNLQVLSMLKLVRVLRLSRIIAHMNSTDDIKLSLRVINLCFFLLLYIHCTGCLWFFIVDNTGQNWLPSQL